MDMLLPGAEIDCPTNSNKHTLQLKVSNEKLEHDEVFNDFELFLRNRHTFETPTKTAPYTTHSMGVGICLKWLKIVIVNFIAAANSRSR